MKNTILDFWSYWRKSKVGAKTSRTFWSHTSFLSVLLLSSAHALAESPVVLVLNTTTKSPLSTPEQQGFLDQIGKEALLRIGLGIKVMALPAERALIDANAGILDGELARVPGVEKIYKNLLIVPEKLMDVEFTIFSITHDKIQPGWEGLNNKTVAFLNGWKILEKNVPASAEVTKVHSPKQLFDLLKLKRVDFIIYEKWGGIALARSMGINNAEPLSPPLAVRHLHMFLHVKHEQYIEPLNNALKQIKTDGTYMKIYKNTLEQLAQQK